MKYFNISINNYIYVLKVLNYVENGVSYEFGFYSDPIII